MTLHKDASFLQQISYDYFVSDGLRLCSNTGKESEENRYIDFNICNESPQKVFFTESFYEAKH